MTLPALIQKQQKKAVSSQLKKFYSMMSQAILLSEAEYGDIEYWSRSDNLRDDDPESAGIKNYNEMKRYWNKYYAPYIKTLRIERSTNNSARNVKIYLADGSLLDVWNGGCMSFSYDTNGDKKPNKGGQDIFYFHVCEAKSQRTLYFGNARTILGPQGMVNIKNREDAMTRCKSGYCAALLIMYDNFEFKDDYPW